MMREEELDNILCEARNALSDNRCFFWLGSEKITEEFEGLNLGDSKEIWPLVFELMHEIQAKNHFILAQDFVIEDQMMSFMWQSRKLGKQMQIIFAVQNGIFYYYSLRSIGVS